MTPEANTSSGGVGREHRPAPHDPEAEAQVIGAALSTASRYPRPNLIPSDFWVPAHRQLWELITTTQGPYCPSDLPDGLRDAARACVQAWTGVDPDIPAVKIGRCMIARAAIEIANRIRQDAYAVDLVSVRNEARELAYLADAMADPPVKDS
jgi:replicative DNA helicase